MAVRLRHVLLLQRDAASLATAVRFWREGVGLTVLSHTERWAELQAGDTRVGLKAVDGRGARRSMPHSCAG